MELTQEQIKALKVIEIDMLRVFIDICKKENIRYFLLGGTALGAVRHKGFIPWDDDIDVGLPREDYKKFLKVVNKYLPEYYFIQNAFTDKNFPFNFSKMRDSRTTFVETTCQNIKMNHGVYIDIFPIDGYSSSKISQWVFKFQNRLLTRRIIEVFVLDNSFKTLRSKTVSNILRIIYPDYRKAVMKRHKLYQRFNYQACEYAANFCGAWAEREIMLKSCFGEGVTGEFEGIEVMLPEKIDQYLTNVYGDYMTLPPEEKRVGHHYVVVADFENPYTNYIEGDKK